MLKPYRRMRCAPLGTPNKSELIAVIAVHPTAWFNAYEFPQVTIYLTNGGMILTYIGFSDYPPFLSLTSMIPCLLVRGGQL